MPHDHGDNPLMNTPRSILISSITALLALTAARSHATLVTYATDANTVQLWHLDEAAGSSLAVAVGSFPGGAFTVDENPVSATPPVVTTVLGAAGFAGFGQAANFTGNTDYVLGFDNNLSGAYDGDVSGAVLSADRISLSSLGINGAQPFTLDAMINLSATAGSHEIICTDSTAATRGFQFRVNASLQLEFNLISGGNGAKVVALPTTGANAFATNTWFHAAVSFNGANLTFFWTKVDPSVTIANAISTQALTITGTAGTLQGPLTFGNDNRNVASEGLNGLLDEIRISNIARTASQFIFTTSGGSFWNNAGGGNWGTPGNWTAAIPNAVSASASFGGGGTPIGVPATIVLDGAKTVGSLTFDNATLGFALASGVAGALTLDNGASAASITVLSGTHAIAVSIALPAAGATFTAVNGADKLTITSAITGAGLLTKGGAGTLEIGDGGSLPATDITISAGALAMNLSAPTVLANNLSGGGALAQNGSGTLTVTGANTHTGGTTVNTSTLVAGSATALGAATAPLTVNGGFLDTNGNSFTVGALKGTGGVITDNSATPGTSTLTVSGATASTFAGILADGPSRTLALVLSATATPQNPLTLTGANTYSGGTTLTRGYLTAGSNNALGTGPVTMSAITGAGNEARIQLASGVTLPNNITVNSFNGGIGIGVLGIAADNTSATYSGTITFNADGIAGGNISGPATSGLLTFSGPINLAGAATFLNLRAGRVQLNGGGSYHSIVIAGTTSIGVNNGISTTAVMTLSTAGPAIFDLNGFNQTLAGLLKTNAVAATVTNSSATASTLTLTPAVAQTYNGAVNGNLTVTVNGTSTQTFSGALGFTTLNQDGTGRTVLNSSLPNATINANEGRLDLNADATNAAVSVDSGAIAYATVSQTLASLTITGTGLFVLTDTPPASPEPVFAGGLSEGERFAPESASAAAVPEPGSAMLLLAGMFALLGVRTHRLS